MRYYLDGTALGVLAGFMPVDGDPAGSVRGHETSELAGWVERYGDQLVSSVLARSEAAPAIAKADHEGRMRVLDALSRSGEVYMSDKAVENAAIIHSKLPAYASLHLGLVRSANQADMARANPAATIQGVVTYDSELAPLCAVYGLEVITPGRVTGWFHVRR